MNEEHVLVSQVYKAKEDMEAADRLIGAYLPFIKSETAKYLHFMKRSGDMQKAEGRFCLLLPC